MRTRSIGLLLLAGMALVASACAIGGPTPSPTPQPQATEQPTDQAAASPGATEAGLTCTTKLKVGIVTDVGRVNDKGFNQSTYEGMRAAAAEAPTCFDTDYIETDTAADYAKNIESFTDAAFDVVIGVGPLLANDLGDAAAANPDAKFIDVDGTPGGCPAGSTVDCVAHDSTWMTNGESLFFAEDEAGYLAGVLAASMSKAGHIGVVGGPQGLAQFERYVEGFINGARSVKVDIPIDLLYATSASDPPSGNAAAKPMIDGGADVIFAAAGITGNGALSAVCEATGVLAIGSDTDQFETIPEVQKCLLSSAMKNVKGAVHDALVRIASDQFKAGPHTDTAATGGIGLAPFHDFDAQVPQAVKDLLATTLAGLADGSITTGVTVDGSTAVPASGPTT
jgi:basic membrane protein A and related proteins